MTQNFNEQFINPELGDIQQPLAGPSETSLFELDSLNKADKTVFEEELSTTTDKQAKEVFNSLTPIAEETKTPAYVVDGKVHEELPKAAVDKMYNEKLPDPPTEEAKRIKKEEIKARIDEEKFDLDFRADELIKEGKLKKHRKDKWIKKESELIDFRGEKEFSDFMKGQGLEYRKKSDVEKETLNLTNKTNNDIQSITDRIQYNLSGIDTSRYTKNSGVEYDTELENKHEQTVKSGVKNIQAFQEAYESGKVKEGDVFRAYDTYGYATDTKTESSIPVYYEATKNDKWEKIIRRVSKATVNPITGQPSVEVPVKNVSEVVLRPDFDAYINYDQRIANLNDDLKNGAIDKQTYDQRVARTNQYKTQVGQENDNAYKSIMADENIPKEVKAIVTASYDSKNFAKLLSEFGQKEEDKKTGIVEFLMNKITVGAAVTGLGAMEKGVEKALEATGAREDVDIPNGTLPIAIKENPALVQSIVKVIKGLGDKAPQYLSTREGISDIMSLVELEQQNIGMNLISETAKTVLPEISNAVKIYTGTANDTKAMFMNHNNTLASMMEKSGYNAAFKAYTDAKNELEKNDDVNVRNAYRFITLQSKLLDTESNATFTERYAGLTEEEKNFVLTVGKDLQLNKNKFLSTIYDKAQKIYELSQKARELFPEKEMKEFEAMNMPKLNQQMAIYKEQEAQIKGLFADPKISSLLKDMQNLQQSAEGSTYSDFYYFPTPSKDFGLKSKWLAEMNPSFGAAIGVLDELKNTISGAKETIYKLSGKSVDNLNLTEKNLAYSLKTFNESLGQIETEDVMFNTAKGIGSAVAQLYSIGKAFKAFKAMGLGGQAGTFSYLFTTGIGRNMSDAAAAGLGSQGQMGYALLSTMVEWVSEKLTGEADLFKGPLKKSILTKELVERVMAKKSRKEALKEIARTIYKATGKTFTSSVMETGEEIFADAGNYLLDNFYNEQMGASFNPSMASLGQNMETFISMLGANVIFKGAGFVGQEYTQRQQLRQGTEELMKAGMSKVDAILMAQIVTPTGIQEALNIMNDVYTGKISRSEVDADSFSRLEKLVPVAMDAGFANRPNLTMEQKTVAMDNMVKANDVAQMLERGEVTPTAAQNLIQTFNENTQKALTDPQFATQQFGINSTEMKGLIYQAFGLSESVGRDQFGALDARTPEQIAASQAAQMDTTPLDRQGFIGKLNEIYVENEDNAAVKRAAQNAIANNPEEFVASEIQNTKNLIEKAKLDFEIASQKGPAPIQQARIDDLTDRLNVLENAKSRYLNSQQYATEISARPQQEGGQPSNLVQPTGVEQRQQEVGQAEGGIGQATQQGADARNRNFGSQAKQAFGQVRQMMQSAGVSGMYMQPIVEGQELDYMDELASQVMENEPAVVRQFGQAVVDRVNKYIADTGLDADVTAVRTAQQRVAGNRVAEARNALIEAINQSNGPANTANKRAVKTLVDRLKKAFPNVKVIMDKKGFQAAVKDEAARDLMTKGGVVYGRVLNGDVYLNPDYANYNTPIHEFGHLWLNAAKEIAPAVYNRGRELIRDSEYMAKLQADPLYEGLSAEEIENEALATAIGDRGEQFVNDVQKQGFRNWVRRLIGKLSQYVGIFNLSKVELDLLTLDEFLNRANASLLAGEAVTFNKMSDRGTMFEVKAYHGSPYSFGKFTTEKIGTGEGAKAFGWGLYFTDVKDIAQHYAEKLGGSDLLVDGSVVKRKDNFEKYTAAHGVATLGYERALERNKELLQEGYLDAATMDKIISEIESLKDKKVEFKKRGVIYDVTLQKGKQPSEYNWLEWDKKVNRERANNLISKLTDSQREQGFGYGLSGIETEEDFYRQLSNALGGYLVGGDKAASLFLLENGIDGIKYPAGGATPETARGFNYVVFDENAVTIEQQQTQFMARQQEPSFKKQMIDLANAVMQRELSKGRTLEEARTIATSEVSAAVIANATGKFNNNAVQKQIENYAGEAYNERKIAEQAAARQRKISQAYTTPETQKILSNANKTAQDIAAANKGKKSKVTSKQAYDTVLGQVKAAIDRMYENGTVPANVSWIDMMSLAPAIASDAVRASFPAANRQRFEGEDMVMMTTSQLIRVSILGQVKAARELAYTGKEVNAIFKALLSQMTNQFGGGLKLSTSEIKAITKSIQDNIFSDASVLNVSENAAEEICKILEKAYRGKLAQETKRLFDKISSETFAAQFIQVYAEQLKNITGKNIESTIEAIVNSNATLEDIAKLNTMLKGIVATGEGKKEKRIDYIAPALNALASINPTVKQQTDNRYESLLTKIKSLIAKATGPNAQSIASLDYEKMLGLMHDMEDVENRRQNIGSLTPEQQAEVLKQYGILKLTPLADIQQYVQTRENEIKRDTALLVDSINQQKRTEASKIREKIPNQLLYNQFLNFMGNLDSEYLSSLSPKELLELKSALNDIVNNGNYNNFAYNQYIKSWQYKIRNDFRKWATSIAANRDKITKDGFTNMFKNKFKDFARTFGSIEGSVPSADLIEKAFDVLFFHQMDVELNSGFDELGMGFLESELFGQLAVVTDQALNKSQANLAPLQEAMISLSDKSNRPAIKKAVGNLWKTYGVKDSLMFKRMMAAMKRDASGGMYEAISVRMASIIANQIDHISNPVEGKESVDMVLQRNILETEKVGQTFKEFFSTTSLNSRFKDFDSMVDHIAYAALTENGTRTLKDLSETDLLALLTPKQREGITKWREYIESNRELFEATQIITGKMNPALKNYIPRNVIGTGDITKIDDVEVYINGQVQTGISQQQLQSRAGDTGKLNLDLNKVLLNNSKTLNTLYYAKPFLDAVKGMGDAIEDIKSGNVPEQRGLTALMPGGETLTDANQFSLAYAVGVKEALTNRVKSTLLSNERTVANNFSKFFRAAAATQSFAAKMWLLSPLRQLNDFVWNTTKTASVLLAETKRAGSLIGVLRVFIPQKAYYRSDKGKFKWEDYVDIADFTGSPIYKMMSIYSDNFIYEFRKTPEQLQRQQRASSWQDMSLKKVAWMEKFENSFYRLTGEYFDHQAFKDERGSYRAMYATTAQRASMAADAMIDRQYGLASVARQPLEKAYLLPFVGRALRNTFGKNILTVKKDSTGALLTGFMMGYASRQYALAQSYMKQAFDSTTNDTFAQRAGHVTRALTETVIPVFGYSLVRSIISNLYTSVYNAISDAIDDDEEKKRKLEELEQKGTWERYMEKTKLSFKDAEVDIIDNIINTAYTITVDPQTQFALRNAIGIGLFYFHKKGIVEDMKNMDREGVKKAKKDLRKLEKRMFGMFNIKMLNLYGGDDYNESVKTFYNANEATAGWESTFETLFGFSALTQVAGQVADMERLVSAAEGANINKTDLLIASGLQLYGLIFSNLYAPGGIGAALSMLSGDATKAGRYIVGEQMRVLRDYNWDHRKEKPYQITIFPGEQRGGGKKKGAYGGAGGYGGSGGYGGGGGYAR